MSGGHFNYAQYQIETIADAIDELIETNDSTEKDSFGCDIGYHYKPETISKFEEAAVLLRMAKIYSQRIDYLVSGDDGEESFHKRLEEDLAALQQRQN